MKEHKIDDLKVTIIIHKPHLIGVPEIDLHKNENNTDLTSTNNFSTDQLHEKLWIQGYRILLPKSWEISGYARILVYAKDDLKIKHLEPQDQHYDHVQNITLEVGFGRSKTHICNFYYREWTSGKNGRKDLSNQLEDIDHLLDIWRNSIKDDKDFVALGDMNVCSKRWDDSTYQCKDIANKIEDFMNEENCSQLIHDYTRLRSVNGSMQRSCIDHVTVNCVGKMSAPVILGVGKSDHLGVIITKTSKEVRTYARTTRKRVYKNFKKEDFLHDIEEAKKAGKFNAIFTTDSPDDAFDTFSNSFCEVLDRHAPIKVIQNRNEYVPYISPHLKQLMAERDKSKEVAAKSGNVEDHDIYKNKRNKVSTLLKQAEKNHYNDKFNDDNLSTKNLWKTAYEVLGKCRSSFPSQILHGGKLVSNPKEIATEVNNYFVNKIK